MYPGRERHILVERLAAEQRAGPARQGRRRILEGIRRVHRHAGENVLLRQRVAGGRSFRLSADRTSRKRILATIASEATTRIGRCFGMVFMAGLDLRPIRPNGRLGELMLLGKIQPESCG